jgi:hypothetical protein
MSRTCVLLTMLTMTQVKAVEVSFYLKPHGATQARTEIISHQILFYSLWTNYT